MQPFWYKNAIVYSLDVEIFMDSGGDDVRDFQGLTHCLDYLAGLGINCLWLLPFYPSPNRDNGYDVMNYYDVDPRLGTLGDFVEFMNQARDRGIRVLIDLVLSLEGRESVRIPMQWSDDPNGGFSTASPDALTRPVISEGEYSYQHVNVSFEQRDPTSFLNWMEPLVRTRKQCPEFGEGKWRILEIDEPAIFAHACEVDGATVIAFHNLSDRPCAVTLKEIQQQHLMEVSGDDFSLIRHDQRYKPLDKNSNTIPINAYGYR